MGNDPWQSYLKSLVWSEFHSDSESLHGRITDFWKLLEAWTWRRWHCFIERVGAPVMPHVASKACPFAGINPWWHMPKCLFENASVWFWPLQNALECPDPFVVDMAGVLPLPLQHLEVQGGIVYDASTGSPLFFHCARMWDYSSRVFLPDHFGNVKLPEINQFGRQGLKRN